MRSKTNSLQIRSVASPPLVSQLVCQACNNECHLPQSFPTMSRHAPRKRAPQLDAHQLLLLVGVARSMRNVRVTNQRSPEQCSRREMRVPDPAQQSKGRALLSLLTLPSNTTAPRLSMMPILNGRLHLGFPWPDEIDHFASHPASYIVVTHGLNCLRPFVLSPRAPVCCRRSSFLDFPCMSGVRHGRSAIWHRSNPPRKTRGAPASYRAELSMAI